MGIRPEIQWIEWLIDNEMACKPNDSHEVEMGDRMRFWQPIDCWLKIGAAEAVREIR